MSDAAVTVLVSGLITITTMVVGFLTIWVKLRYGEKKTDELAKQGQVVEGKVDANTALTKSGTASATFSAKAAAEAASTAATKTDELSKRMNGELDGRISDIVKKHIDPLIEAFRSHSDQDDKNMAEIRQSLRDITKEGTERKDPRK